MLLALVALRATTQPGLAWLDVPFVRQQKDGCGSASLAMVIRYWMKEQPNLRPEDADVRQIQQALQSPGARRLPAAALIRYLEDRGFDAFAFAGEWQDLESHIAKGRPLIACLSNGRSRPLHYLVLVGVGKDKVVVNDPVAGKLQFIERSDFEPRWAGAGNWTLLAVPHRTP